MIEYTDNHVFAYYKWRIRMGEAWEKALLDAWWGNRPFSLLRA